jgi:hypothetical protein
MEPDQSPKRLFDRCQEIIEWRENVPADLIPAVEHLRRSFDWAHWNCGRITEILGFSLLHRNEADDETSDYVSPLMQLKATIGTAATYRFNDLVRQGTPSAIFKAFYDLYIDGVTVQALAIFRELAAIGRANQMCLSTPHLEWAELQAKHMIRSEMHLIGIWVREVCDRRCILKPDSLWTDWQAPFLVIMRPSRFQPYDAATAWDRADVETSSGWLKSFAEHYVIHLEAELKRAAGEAALELAKQPKLAPPAGPTTANGAISPTLPGNGRPPINVRREARKLDTQAMYESWQKEYRNQVKKRPDMSDVWYSQQIAKLDIAKGSNAETIRKHMKK